MEEKKWTLEDIAEELGVSTSTVSRALSGQGRISEATRERVLACCREHHYHPNAVARSLAQSKTCNIGLALPGDYAVSDLPFFQKCMLGVSRAAAKYGYDVLLSMVEADDILQLKREADNHKVDGFLLTRTLADDKAVQFLQKVGMPFVAIGSSTLPGVIQVDHDHREACYTLTRRLIGQGVQKPALLGGSQTAMVNGNRLDGFLGACRKEKIHVPPEHILSDADTDDDLREKMIDWLKEGVDCVFAMDDALCMRALDILRQLHVSVPAGLQVASFYDSEFLEQYSPAVTAIRFPVEELGVSALETLLKVVKGEDVPQRRLLRYQICMRDSTVFF